MQLRRVLVLATLLVALIAGSPQTAVGGPQAAAEAEAPQAVDASDLLPNGLQPAAGLVVGGQPTLEQLQELDELGYTTVINLRSAAEMTDKIAGRDEVEGLGMDYVFIPVASPADLTRENVQRFADALEAADGPIVVHCASGNRVGALFALKAFYLDDVAAEEALEIGRSSGLTRMESVVRQQMDLEGAKDGE